MAEKYYLRVTAGPSYDPETHVVLPVNTEKSTTLRSEYATTRLKVRVQNYRGLPHGSPETSPYFSGDHKDDQYSIEFDFVPHATFTAENLVFGNDFDRPIRDRLPPGFSYAFGIVKWWIDPGLEGDVYADKPHLYGPALSSLNVIRAGGKAERSEGNYELGPESEDPLQEGADADGEEWRKETAAPETQKGRKAWALDPELRKKWEWEEGRIFHADFFNPYLDFNEFSLKLPGFTLGVLSLLEGKDMRNFHELRYVLKDKETDNVVFVLLFTLLLKEEVDGKPDDEQPEDKKEEGKEPEDNEAEPRTEDID